MKFTEQDTQNYNKMLDFFKKEKITPLHSLKIAMLHVSVASNIFLTLYHQKSKKSEDLKWN